MSDKIKACHCGYEGSLLGTDNGVYLFMSCSQCSREVTAFTIDGLIEAWNKPSPEQQQERDQ